MRVGSYRGCMQMTRCRGSIACRHPGRPCLMPPPDVLEIAHIIFINPTMLAVGRCQFRGEVVLTEGKRHDGGYAKTESGLGDIVVSVEFF